jgi:hypothetical protein
MSLHGTISVLSDGMHIPRDRQRMAPNPEKVQLGTTSGSNEVGVVERKQTRKLQSL